MTRGLAAAAMLLLATAGIAPRSEAGDVTGGLRLPLRPPSTPGASLYDKYGGGKSHAEHGPAPAASQGVVFLRSPGGALPRFERPVPVMDQAGIQFVPRILPVQVGEQVRFKNSDPVFHNVFSLSPVKKFDLGRHPKGDSRLVPFPQAGVVQVFCDIHAGMVGFVVVVDSPYFAEVGLDGRFRLEDVPAGTYEVLAWGEGMNAFESAGRVEVPAAGSVEFSPTGSAAP